MFGINGMVRPFNRVLDIASHGVDSGKFFQRHTGEATTDHNAFMQTTCSCHGSETTQSI